jgi:hypothetical protein
VKKADLESLVDPKAAIFITCRWGFLPQVLEEALTLAKKKKKPVIFEFNERLLMVKPDSDTDKVWRRYVDSLPRSVE